MANYIGKTREFATELMNYYINNTDMGAREALYIGLLSAVPTGNEPYHASAISGVEVSAGKYRMPLPGPANITVATVEGLSAVRAINTTSIDFPVAPGSTTATFNISGYCLVRGAAGTNADDYIGYELFVPTPSKQRLIRGGDTIRINADGLSILEK